jgi:hypothetical protein
MMVKREVLRKFAEAFPPTSLQTDHRAKAHFDGSRYIACFL